MNHQISIGILTGRRLDLFRRTIAALQNCIPSLLQDAYVVVYLNGRDDPSDEYVRSLPFLDDYMYVPFAVPEPIGDAVSRMARHLIGKSEYHIHLEDDWLCTAANLSFLERSKDILDRWLDVGQVRLRSRSEMVMSQHMVTHLPCKWKRQSDGTLLSGLHFTFNPSLMRTRDLEAIYPAGSEIEAAKNFARQFSKVAQHDPGVFFHIGEGDASLRQALGR